MILNKQTYKHLMGFGMFTNDKPSIDMDMGYAKNMAEKLVQKIDKDVKEDKTEYSSIHYYLGALMKHCIEKDDTKPYVIKKPNMNDSIANKLNNEIGYELIDHLERWYWKKGQKMEKTWVSHSYGTNMIQLKKLIEFCEKHNLYFSLSAQHESYFPGHTFTVVISTIKHKKVVTK